MSWFNCIMVYSHEGLGYYRDLGYEMVLPTNCSLIKVHRDSSLSGAPVYGHLP